jgi:mRNA interferase RelE/StbE
LYSYIYILRLSFVDNYSILGYGMKELTYTAKALKQLRLVPEHDRKAIMSKMSRYVSGEITGIDVKMLKGSSDYRLRHGVWRAIFTDQGRVVEVVRVAHRREIY